MTMLFEISSNRWKTQQIVVRYIYETDCVGESVVVIIGDGLNKVGEVESATITAET